MPLLPARLVERDLSNKTCRTRLVETDHYHARIDADGNGAKQIYLEGRIIAGAGAADL
jgi:hypothetical protein